MISSTNSLLIQIGELQISKKDQDLNSISLEEFSRFIESNNGSVNCGLVYPIRTNSIKNFCRDCILPGMDDVTEFSTRGMGLVGIASLVTFVIRLPFAFIQLIWSRFRDSHTDVYHFLKKQNLISCIDRYDYCDITLKKNGSEYLTNRIYFFPTSTWISRFTNDPAKQICPLLN